MPEFGRYTALAGSILLACKFAFWTALLLGIFWCLQRFRTSK